MNILKDTTFKWWQVGALKLALLLFGVAIGVTWPSVFLPYIYWIIIVALVLALYIAVVWFRQI